MISVQLEIGEYFQFSKIHFKYCRIYENYYFVAFRFHF